MTEAAPPEGRGDEGSRPNSSGSWLDRSPIGHRMALAVGLPIALLLLGAIFVGVQVNEIEEMEAQGAEERRELARVVELDRSFAEVVTASHTYVMTGDTQNRSRMDAQISSFQTGVSDLEDSIEGPQRLQTYDQLESNATTYIDRVRQAQEHVEASEPEEAQSVLTSPEATAARTNAANALEDLRSAEQQDVDAQRQAITERHDDLDRGVFLGGLVAVLASTALAYEVTQRASSTLSRLQGKLRDRLAQLEETQETERGYLTSQAERLDETQDRVGTVDAGFADVDERLGNATEMAGEIEEAAVAGNERLDATLSSLDDVDANVSTVAERVLDIGEQLDQLADAANDVGAIADQTDMLALNASVEASHGHAGGQGLGEVRDLAERARSRASRIQAIVQEAREEIDAAALALEQGGKAVDETRTGALETSEAFTDVEDSLQDGLEEMEDLEQVAREQSEAIQEAEQVLGDAGADVEELEAVQERTERLLADLEEARRRLAEVA